MEGLSPYLRGRPELYGLPRKGSSRGPEAALQSGGLSKMVTNQVAYISGRRADRSESRERKHPL